MDELGTTFVSMIFFQITIKKNEEKMVDLRNSRSTKLTSLFIDVGIFLISPKLKSPVNEKTKFVFMLESYDEKKF